jgi:heat shock protein HspQ
LRARGIKSILSAMVSVNREAKYRIGQVVRHRIFAFRGVIFDVDPTFNNTEEWWLSIPENVRPRKDQPFYHLLAENEQTTYIAYVSEQNLLPDETGMPVRHPDVGEHFGAITPLNIHPVSSSMAASCMLRIGPLPQVGREMVRDAARSSASEH